MAEAARLMRLAELRQRLTGLDAKPAHVAQYLRAWAQHLPLGTRARPVEHHFPLALRNALPALQAELDGLARLRSQHAGEEGARLLVELADGQLVESVLLLRDGLCVSTQVGCAVGCVFCMTGRDGLLRQLGSAEIVAQVVLARQLKPIRKVVFMGMGEPAHNLDNVLEAIDLLGQEGNIGHKNLVFSTVGDPRVFAELPRGRVKPALALSLHTSRAGLRRELLPRAAALTPAQLVDAGEAYARATGYPIQYQWTLIEGVNDGPDEIAGALALLRGKYAILNLIPYNRIDALPYHRPAMAAAQAMARQLCEGGVLTKLRNSVGQDVDGGCGQLRARAADAIRTQRVEFRARRDERPDGAV